MKDALDDFLDTEYLAPQEPETPAEPEQGEKALEEPTPPVVEAPDVEGLKQAMIAERRKRQELEAKLAQQKEEERPFLGEEYEARFKETESRFEQRLVSQKLDLSEAFAREKYSDWDEKLTVFEGMMQGNPNLYATMVQQVNPAEYAYKTASNQLKLKEMANPDEYEAKLKAKWEAEFKAKMDKEAAKREELPGTLAATRGVGQTAQTWAGPEDLKSVLG